MTNESSGRSASASWPPMRTDASRRELAEFEKLKKMKNQLQKIYEQMHLVPTGHSQPRGGMGN